MNPFTSIPPSNQRQPASGSWSRPAGRWFDDLTPLRLLEAREASGVLNELTNRPGTFWDGATGERDELAAGRVGAGSGAASFTPGR